jgi:catalase
MQLNRVSNDIAKRVARALNVEEPQPDPTYYHDNKTTDVGVFGTALKRLDGLKIGVLASVAERSSIDEANALRSSFASDDVDVIVVAERFEAGVDQTYSASDAINFDAIIVADGADGLFAPNSITVNASSTLYPAGRPLQILLDGFRFGKPVGALGTGAAALDDADIPTPRAGVYVAESPAKKFVDNIKEGLATFKFLDRFALDEE